MLFSPQILAGSRQRAASGGGSWLPSNLATLNLWLKGDALSGSDGDALATWVDASGLSRDATQSSSNKPTLKVAHQNGLNVVKLEATSLQYFNLPNAFTALTEGAVAFVAKNGADPPAGSAGSYDGPIVKLGSQNSNLDHYPYAGDSNIYGSFASTTRKSVGNPTSSLANYHVGGFRSKASDWRYFLNGTQFFNTGTNAVGWTTTPRIGSSGDGDNGTGFLGFNVNAYEGFIAEIVLLGEFASTLDWQKVEGYLAWKWGLVSDLDGSHPYKSSPP